MDTLEFAAYSSFVLVVFVLLSFLEVLMEVILENWDVIGLLVSNIVALFIDPKKIRRKK